MFAFEKVGQQLHAKPIGDPVSSDAAATRSAALRLGHAFWTALVLAQAHARVRLITVYRIVFASFGGERACLGIGRELDEFLMSF